MELKLKKFDIKRIRDDEIIVLIGKRNTGKSFLIKDILYHHKDIPVGTVISPTEAANSFYSPIVPKLFIHDDYSEEIVKNVLKRQKKISKRIKQGESDIDSRAFLLMDDCLYENSWKSSKYIRECFMNGRHWNLMYMLTMQYALGVPPTLRTNIDFVFILRENFVQNRRRLYECYAGMFPTFDIFCTTMDQCTENYECLVIHNSAKSNKLEDQVYWYKAEAHDDFKIGSDAIWEYSELHCNEDEEDEYSEVNSYKKGNHPKVNIKKV